MDSDSLDFLQRLLNTPSPTGWESAGQKVWATQVRSVSDRVESDAYGNHWAILQGTTEAAPKIMLEAHADEIGFIVRHIDDKGFLTMAPLGGSDRTLASARRIRIFGDRGEVQGVFGNTAIHLRDTSKDKILPWHELYADVGASSEAEAAVMGLRVGQPAVFLHGSERLGEHRLVGRALDNRIGGFILAEVLRRISDLETKPAATVQALNAVQEEIGSYGAQMAAHRLRPDLAIIFDVTHATDTPGINSKEHGAVHLGKGPTLSHGAANQSAVVRRLLKVAADHQIPIQHEAISRSTRTDADVIFTARDGIASALISIPLRYMHSPTETIDLRDVEAAINLTVAFVLSINESADFALSEADHLV